MSHPLSKRVLHHNSAEAGWYAASEAGMENIYLRSILFDFGFEQDGRDRHGRQSCQSKRVATSNTHTRIENVANGLLGSC